MKINAFVLFFSLAALTVDAQGPLSLHPKNQHYFMFKGKPIVLISSAEHYGALLNLDIDYKKYLAVLAQYGFNQTRVFSGFFCEGNEYDIEKGKTYSWDDIQNTLSPRPGKFIAPWARSGTPGYIRSGNKFDLDKWDENYFNRLKDLLKEANTHGVIVEIVLFTAIYSPKLWLNSPLNPINNINDTEAITYNEFHLPEHQKLFARQLDMVKKIVQEVNAFDNVYFEICNEPYWIKGIPGNDSPIKEQQFLPEIETWEQKIAETITETEKNLPKKHLIAQNIANNNHKMTTVDPAVSILNFHYAFPPACITDNYGFNKPIGFDETSDGCNAPNRRREAWAFLLSGGAVYSNLDWSYATDDVSGLGRNPSGRRQSGKEVREQLKILADEIGRFDFVSSKPLPADVLKNIPEGLRVYGIHIPGKDYMIYLLKEKKTSDVKASLELPAGKYTIRFTDPLSGVVVKNETRVHAGGDLLMPIPPFSDDLVVRITK